MAPWAYPDPTDGGRMVIQTNPLQENTVYTMKYYGFIKTSKDRYEAQLELVEAVLTHGIKPTAKLYGTTKKTVRK